MTREAPADHTQGPRLNGWKEIAAHLGRGVRTAQRWEREFGLPVRRLGGDRSESVFAFTAEVDTWLASTSAAGAHGQHETPDPEPVPDSPPVQSGVAPAQIPAAGWLPTSAQEARNPLRQPRLWLWLLATAVVVLGSVGLWREWVVRQPGPPASWRIDANALVVLDTRGVECWRYEVPIPLNLAEYKVREERDMGGSVGIEDLDGDGAHEVWFVAIPAVDNARESRFYVFGEDGTVRWQYQFKGPVTFGTATTSGPWVAYRVFVTEDPANPGRRAMWAVSRDSAEYPCVLQRVDPASGRPMSTYWSNGWIDAVVLWRTPAGPRLLVGGSNNDHVAAGLAVLDALNPNGHAPAAHAKYRCNGCPAGDPLAFVVFPKPARFAPDGSSGAVQRVVVGGEPAPLTVTVQYTAAAGMTAVATYRLDAQLNPVHADVSDTYELVYMALVSRGALPPYKEASVAPERELLPLYRWQDGQFVAVGLTPASSSTSSSPAPAR